MAVQRAIVTVLTELESATNRRTIIEVDTQRVTIRRLVELLHSENAIKIVRVQRNRHFIKINKSIVKISATPEFKNISNEDLVFELRSLVPTVTGTVILTTPEGLITHRQALDREIGGRVVGFFFK